MLSCGSSESRQPAVGLALSGKRPPLIPNKTQSGQLRSPNYEAHMHAVNVSIDKSLCIATVFGNSGFVNRYLTVWVARVRNTQYCGGLLEV